MKISYKNLHLQRCEFKSRRGDCNGIAQFILEVENNDGYRKQVFCCEIHFEQQKKRYGEFFVKQANMSLNINVPNHRKVFDGTLLFKTSSISEVGGEFSWQHWKDFGKTPVDTKNIKVNISNVYLDALLGKNKILGQKTQRMSVNNTYTDILVYRIKDSENNIWEVWVDALTLNCLNEEKIHSSKGEKNE